MANQKMQEYLARRYQHQVRWYDNKAKKYKWLANTFQAVIITFAALTPMLVSALDQKIFAITSSSIVAIASGIVKYFKMEDHWRNYRTTCETLKKEKHFHNFKIGGYEDAEDADKLFVSRVESIISKENTGWLTTVKKKDSK